MYIGYSCKVPVLLAGFFKDTRIFRTDFRKNVKMSNFIKIRSLGAQLLHVDERTDMTKLMFAFRNLRTRLKIYNKIS
jgi:hypothetical protein